MPSHGEFVVLAGMSGLIKDLAGGNYSSSKHDNKKTIAGAGGDPLQIKWFEDSYMSVPIWK